MLKSYFQLCALVLRAVFHKLYVVLGIKLKSSAGKACTTHWVVFFSPVALSVAVFIEESLFNCGADDYGPDCGVARHTACLF